MVWGTCDRVSGIANAVDTGASANVAGQGRYSWSTTLWTSSLTSVKGVPDASLTRCSLELRGEFAQVNERPCVCP